MKTLTPEELKSKIRRMLNAHPGTVASSHVRYAFQLTHLDTMPDSKYCGALWSPTLGVIVYMTTSDKAWVEAHQDYILAEYYNPGAVGIRPPQYKDGDLYSGKRKLNTKEKYKQYLTTS